MARKTVLWILVLFCVGSAAFAEAGDVLLVIPPAVKFGLSFFALGATIRSIPNTMEDLITTIPATLLLGVPSGFLLWNFFSKNAEGVRVWRTVSIFTDAATALALVGAGTYILVDSLASPSGGEDWGPLIAIIAYGFALPFGLATALDFAPFPMETAAAK